VNDEEKVMIELSESDARLLICALDCHEGDNPRLTDGEFSRIMSAFATSFGEFDTEFEAC